MDYLARREHARGELLAKLTGFGFETGVAEEAIASLADDGLQSDERFVEAFVRSRVQRGKGPMKIRAELREHGVDDALIDAGLDEAAADWCELARAVREKKFGAGVPADFATKARQMRFLQSRGFESGHIRAAVSDDV